MGAFTEYFKHGHRAGILIDTLLWPFFLYGALGVAFDWSGAAAIAENFKYWFLFELTGTLMFGISVEMMGDFRRQFGFGRRGELAGYGIVYALFALAWFFWFKLHFMQLLLAMAVTLPGQALAVTAAGEEKRAELGQRAGFSVVAFIAAVAAGSVTLHFIFDPPYRLLPKSVEAQFGTMLLGAIYFCMRTVFEFRYRRAFGPAR